MVILFFFFKQKTAYEMRISDWSSDVCSSDLDKKEKVGRMLLMHANSREDIEEAYAGDIVALAGLKETTTGDTLCATNAPIILERMEFPEPVIELSVEPKTKIGRASCRERVCQYG